MRKGLLNDLFLTFFKVEGGWEEDPKEVFLWYFQRAHIRVGEGDTQLLTLSCLLDGREKGTGIFCDDMEFLIFNGFFVD